jgi:iron complex outermembrane receptor protein
MSGRFRRCFTIIVLILGGIIAAPTAFAQTSYSFNLPEQALADSLRAIGQQTEMNILFEPEAVKNARSPALRGQFTVDDAIRLILAGTKLEAQHTTASNVVIKVKSARSTTLPATSADTPGRSGARLVQSNSGGPQSQPATGPQNTDTSNSTSEFSKKEGLSEIIVTAEKRSARLQDTPVPVSVISAATLANSDQVLLRDYYSSVAGLSMTTTTQSSQILSIRGILTNPGNPTVGITVDDMPFGSSTIAGGGLVVPDFDPGDLSRIEVLRGPQGTLYGASSLGGLIKFVTVDPSTQGVFGSVQAGLSDVHNGNDVGYIYRGAVNVPLGDSLAVRASGFVRRDPGYIDNPVRDENGLNVANADGGLLSALWQSSPDVSLKITALLQEVKGEGSSDVDIEPGLGDLQQNYIPGVGGYERSVQAYFATLKAKLGNFNLTSITGYNINRFSDSWDYTFALAPNTQMQFGVPGTPILNYNKTDKFTQEIRLSSSVGQKIDWSIGAFYTYEDSKYVQYLLAENVTTGAIVGSWCNCSSPSAYTEYALFPDLTYHVTNRFDIQLGARASQIRQIFRPEVFVGPYTEAFLGQPSPVVVPSAYASGNPFTYLATPRFQVTPDLMIYARLASGYRAGGSNQGVPGVPAQYSPDKTQNYEIGAKGDFLNHTFSLDASIYYINWKDIQLSFIDPQNFMAYTGNGTSAKSQGVELSMRWAATENLTISGWVTYDEAELTEAFPAAVVAAGEFGLSGDRLPFSSRYSGYLSVDEKFTVADGWTGFVGGDLSYVGDRLGFFTATSQRTDFPSYAKVDLHAGTKHDAWTVNLFANNVADKRAAIAGGMGYFPPFAFQYIQPRTIGFNVSYAF